MGVVQSPTESQDNLVLRDSASGQMTKYLNASAYLNELYKPDNREQLMSPYGKQLISGLYGLLGMVGFKKASGTNDQVTWWEERRLHQRQDGTIAATSSSDTGAKVITNANHTLQVDQKVRIADKVNGIVTAVTAGQDFTVTPQGTSWGVDFSANEPVRVIRIGSEYAQGTNQPTVGELSNLDKYTNSYVIDKDVFAATGSEMTNLSWVEVNGSRLYYKKGMIDFEFRWRNRREARHILDTKITNTNLSSLSGSEGLFSAIENRGITHGGMIQDLTDIENIILATKQQNPSATEFACYLSTQQFFKVSKLIASLNGETTPSYGMFQNQKDMAISLDFKSMSYAGVTFHFHEWPLLVDPQWLGGSTGYYHGVIIPMGKTTDAKTGDSNPYLEHNYKAAEGYSREDETFIIGAANGTFNDSNGYDGLKYMKRCEDNLTVRCANTFTLIRG